VSQERAFEESQKYKEGKFILEKAKLMKVGWPDQEYVVSVAATCGSIPDLASVLSQEGNW
jgi:hypothetical protein